MAQHMPFSVLAHKVPQVCSQTHVCDGRLVIAPSLNGEAFEKNKPLSVDEFFADGLDPAGEFG